MLRERALSSVNFVARAGPVVVSCFSLIPGSITRPTRFTRDLRHDRRFDSLMQSAIKIIARVETVRFYPLCPFARGSFEILTSRAKIAFKIAKHGELDVGEDNAKRRRTSRNNIGYL